MLVSVTSVLVTDGGEEIASAPCIYYPIRFQENQRQKGQEQVKALLDSGIEVNAMSPAYVKRLGLKPRKTNVGAQKIDGSALETFGMMIADF